MSPYSIFISEVMLQQTQVARVIDKYQEFLHELPNFEALANAELSTVLRLWSGLGYNRRARYLKHASEIIVREYGGQLPSAPSELVKLPGVGPNTAGSIAAFAFNQPVIFIETNIRAVFLHHFFLGQAAITDGQLLSLVGQTLDADRPREWYWALMDYGSRLKKELPNPSRASKHHVRQSKFEGSIRQIRGEVLRQLLKISQTEHELARNIDDGRLSRVLIDLERDGLITRDRDYYRIS